jgi:8-oxo-dGTP pyrophosphatase MutT (NUDIX family)
MGDELKQYKLNMPDKTFQEGGKRDQFLTVASGGMIFAHNKVLLDKSEASDLWSIPGGVVRFDESPQETVIRELREELNLRVSIIDHEPYVYYFTMDTGTSIDRIILLHFLVKLDETANIKMGGDIVDYRWESIGSNFRDCYPNIQPAVDHFMKI